LAGVPGDVKDLTILGGGLLLAGVRAESFIGQRWGGLLGHLRGGGERSQVWWGGSCQKSFKVSSASLKTGTVEPGKKFRMKIS